MSMHTYTKAKYTQAGSGLAFPIFQHLALHFSYSFNISFMKVFFSKHSLDYINSNSVLYVTKNIHMQAVELVEYFIHIHEQKCYCFSSFFFFKYNHKSKNYKMLFLSILGYIFKEVNFYKKTYFILIYQELKSEQP